MEQWSNENELFSHAPGKETLSFSQKFLICFDVRSLIPLKETIEQAVDFKIIIHIFIISRNFSLKQPYVPNFYATIILLTINFIAFFN